MAKPSTSIWLVATNWKTCPASVPSLPRRLSTTGASTDLSSPPDNLLAAGRDRYSINLDSKTTVKTLSSVGVSPESAIRLVSGDLSLLIPRSIAPLTPPPSWRADLVVLGNRPPSTFTTPAFLDSTGAAALVAGLGPGGSAVIRPGGSLSDTVAPGPPAHQSSSGAAVRLQQTGVEYSITFVRS